MADKILKLQIGNAVHYQVFEACYKNAVTLPGENTFDRVRAGHRFQLSFGLSLLPPVRQNPVLYHYRTGDWYIDFANRQFGGGLFMTGLVQEEIMCLEFFELAFLAARRPKPLESGEAFVMTNLTRFSEIHGLYGRQALQKSKHTQKHVLATASPVHVNVIAMDAPRQERGISAVRYNIVELAQLLSKAFAGFSTARSTANGDVKINTGHWGCGAYNNHAGVMAAVQCMAASLAKCGGLVYHLPHDAFEANSLAQQGVEFVCSLEEQPIESCLRRLLAHQWKE